MNQQVVTGSLVDGGSYRANSYMVEVTDNTGAVRETVDMNDIKSVTRRGTRLTIKRRQGSDLTLDAASLDDADLLETLIRVSTAKTAPAARQRGGFARRLMIGCGGLMVVLVVVGVIIAIAGGSGGSNESSPSTATVQASAGARASEGVLADGGTATAEGLNITIVQVVDPYTSPNQFSRPAAGTRFVALKVLFENVGGRSASVNAFSFKLIDAENFQHNFESVVFSEPSLVGQGQQLGAGAKLEGWIGFEVKDGVALKELAYEPNRVTTTDHHFRVP